MPRLFPQLKHLIVGLLLAILLIASTACGGGKDRSEQAAEVLEFDEPGAFSVVIANEAAYDGRLLSREQRWVLLRDVLPQHPVYFSMTPQDEIAKRPTVFSETDAYVENITEDLAAADEFCTISQQADRCLVVSLNYQPCQENGVCEYHAVTEVTMVIADLDSDDWLAVYAFHTDSPSGTEKVTEAINRLAEGYESRNRFLPNGRTELASFGQLTDNDSELIEELNQALTEYDELLREADSGVEHSDEVSGKVLERVFAAIDELFSFPILRPTEIN